MFIDDDLINLDELEKEALKRLNDATMAVISAKATLNIIKNKIIFRDLESNHIGEYSLPRKVMVDFKNKTNVPCILEDVGTSDIHLRHIGANKKPYKTLTSYGGVMAKYMRLATDEEIKLLFPKPTPKPTPKTRRRSLKVETKNETPA